MKFINFLNEKVDLKTKKIAVIVKSREDIIEAYNIGIKNEVEGVRNKDGFINVVHEYLKDRPVCMSFNAGIEYSEASWYKQTGYTVIDMKTFRSMFANKSKYVRQLDFGE